MNRIIQKRKAELVYCLKKQKHLPVQKSIYWDESCSKCEHYVGEDDTTVTCNLQIEEEQT